MNIPLFYLNHAISLEGSALGELHYLWLDIYYSLYIYLMTYPYYE
jgi:hypothetical protein